MSAQIWSGALVASVLLHGAGLAALALSTEPEVLPDQDIPKSRFSVEAAEVPRSRAAPETPQAVAAPPSDAPSTAAQSGTIPLAHARPSTPRTQALGPSVSDTPALAAISSVGARAAAITANLSTVLPSAPRPNATSASALNSTTLVASAAAAASLLASAPPRPTQVTGLKAPAATLKPASAKAPRMVAAGAVSAAAPLPEISAAQTPTLSAAAPAPDPTPLSTVSGARVASAPPDAAPAPSATPKAAPSDALPLPAVAGKAALAWSGTQDAPVSATSLAAIAAFTQAGDLQTASAQIRDGIEGILASVPCARLQTTFLPETGQLELRGHIPEDGLRGPVLAALQDQVGAAIQLSDQLLILPRPQCGALSGIAAVGLPQSTEQLTDPAVIGEDGFARNYTYVEGERLRLDLTAPDYDSYIYMDYFVADGSVIHLQPNEIVPLEFAPAKSAQSVGRARQGKPFLELTISPPFGQEIAAAFATSVPLYEGTRPLQEPADAYLAFLKERIAAARAAHPDFKGEWVYFFISTEAG